MDMMPIAQATDLTIQAIFSRQQRLLPGKVLVFGKDRYTTITYESVAICNCPQGQEYKNGVASIEDLLKGEDVMAFSVISQESHKQLERIGVFNSQGEALSSYSLGEREYIVL